MARGKAPEKLPPPRLVVSREAAREQIRERIEKGIPLRDRQILSPEELDRARKERRKWSDFNTELLTRIFDNESVAEEYNRSPGMFSIPMDPSLGERIEDFRDDMATSITRLESVLERLDLIPEAQPHHSPARPIRAIDNRKVFLVHGHDEGAKQSVARFLEKLSLEPVVLHEQPNQGRTIIEKFEHYSAVSFAVVLLTPDDIGASKSDPSNIRDRARQNVLLELGFFLGALGRSRVCALYGEGVELPSDYLGVLYVPLDAAGGWRLKLAAELKASGVEVDLNKAV
jgi:predicted nucleotide-binding protein